MTDHPKAFYSASCHRNIKGKIEKLWGGALDLRMLRRTYGQMMLDSNPGPDVDPLALGRRSIETTQKYYCQKRMDALRSEVLQAFAETQKGPCAANPLIETRTDHVGYT